MQLHILYCLVILRYTVAEITNTEKKYGYNLPSHEHTQGFTKGCQYQFHYKGFDEQEISKVTLLYPSGYNQEHILYRPSNKKV